MKPLFLEPMSRIPKIRQMLAQSLFSTKFDLKASKLNKFGLEALFHKNTRSQCNKMYRYQLEVFFIPNLSLKLPNWPTIELKNYFLWKQVFLGSLQLDVCFLLNIHPRCHLIYCSAFSTRLNSFLTPSIHRCIFFSLYLVLIKLMLIYSIMTILSPMQ